MAVDIAGTEAKILLISSAPTTYATICAWVKHDAFGEYDGTISWAHATDGMVIHPEYGSPNDWQVRGGGSSATIGLDHSTDWTFLCIAGEFQGADYNEITGYGQDDPDAALVSGQTRGVASGSATQIGVGGYAWTRSYHPFDGIVANVKVWDVELTLAEIEQERRVLRPVRKSNLWAWWPLIGTTAAQRYQDWSGNGRTLSNNGSDPARADGPPIPWGAAIIICGEETSPPQSVTGAHISSGATLYAPAIDYDAYVWGESAPTGGEGSRSWQGWETAPATPVNVQGDADWGVMEIREGDSNYGDVVDTGDTSSKTFSITEDVYGAGGRGSTSLYIRGSATSFGQHDGSPTWNAYSGPTLQSWRYVQIRVDRAAP